MSNFDWSAHRRADGDFPDKFKFDNVGDAVVGVITRIDVVPKFDPPTPVIEVKRDDGTAVSVFVSQVNLVNQMADLRPQVGDRVAIVLTGFGEPTQPGYSPPKLFDVQLAKGTEPAQANPAPAGQRSAADLLGTQAS